MESSAKKKIAIVGGGFSGLTCIVRLMEEDIESVCFEKTSSPGGTWCYREESVIGVPSIMPTTTLNHSKEMGALSNCPPSRFTNNFMRHSEIYEKFLKYAYAFGAMKFIQCNSEVVDVKRTADYDETGKWIVSVKNTLDDSVSSNVYDGVMICVGHFNIPHLPSFKDQDEFKGEVIHSHSLKGVSKYENKNVVVVGMGCSGLDAAVEISSVAKQVYLSTRSGAYVLPRVGPRGYPMDYIIMRRYIFMLLNILPSFVLSWIIENFIINPKFSPNLYAVKPKVPFLGKDPVINDHIASKLLDGSVIQKPNIEKFTEKGVKFEGDILNTNADAVIMATGYSWQFPFLQEGVLEVNGDCINLYKCMWPPNLKHPTLAFLGFILPFGPGFPIGEMQGRWAAHVFSGKGKLPSRKEMMKEITKRHESNKKRYSPSSTISLHVDFIQYLDSIADDIGVKPKFFRMVFTDPKLFIKLLFGPHLVYQYRLQGPHSWDGARECIMKCEERVLKPLQGNYETVESPFIIFIKKLLMSFLPFA